MHVVLLLLLLPVIVLGSALLTTAAGLPMPWPPLLTGLVAMAYLAGFTVYLVMRVIRAGRSLDDVFAAAGLSFVRRMGVACVYEGPIDGRKLSATFFPAYRFQPWRMEFVIEAKPRVRMALGSTRPLLDCRQAPRLEYDRPGFERIHIHTEQAEATGVLLNSSAVREALDPLVADWNREGSWELYMQPDRLTLRYHTDRLNAAAVPGWLARLVKLAQACEEEKH